MLKIFATSKSRIFFILEDRVKEAKVTKCTGYFMEGIFFGVSIIEQKTVKGMDLFDTKELLELFFKTVFKRDTIKNMQVRMTAGKGL